jgi:MOSC domain-containing protein YiiM
MRVLSVNIAQPRTVEFDGRTTTTGIFKEPVAGRVRVTGLTLEGDHQVDRRYHGGANKAVYGYASEHYAGWEEFLGGKFPPGQFGENLTTEGLLEESVYLGDVYCIGSALLQVTQPRVPCFKLGLKMRMPSFPKWFLKSGRLGFYFRVLEEGDVGAGDPIEKVREDGAKVSIRGLWQLAYGGAEADRERVLQILQRDYLAGEWTRPLREKL